MTAANCITKQCARCNEEKSLDSFYLVKKTGKPHSYCRQCCSANTAAHAAKNRDAKKAYNAEYREKNIERLRVYDAERSKQPERKEAKKGGSTRWRNKNLEKCQDQERKYREKNREQINAANRARRIPVPRKTSYTAIGKVCAKCGADKPLSEFYTRADQPGKYRAHCGVCIAENTDREAAIERGKRWREANPDRAKEMCRAWRSSHPAYDAERWAKNPEYGRAANKRNYAKHRAKRLKQSAMYRRENRATLSAYLSDWWKKNAAKAAEYRHRRRANKRKAGGTHTAADIKRIHGLQRGCCAACFKPLKGKYHVDHRVALARGGSNDWTNIQLLHATCNMRKHARDPVEYMQKEHGLLL